MWGCVVVCVFVSVCVGLCECVCGVCVCVCGCVSQMIIVRTERCRFDWTVGGQSNRRTKKLV